MYRNYGNIGTLTASTPTGRRPAKCSLFIKNDKRAAKNRAFSGKSNQIEIVSARRGGSRISMRPHYAPSCWRRLNLRGARLTRRMMSIVDGCEG
jgi:hypothetical protein